MNDIKAPRLVDPALTAAITQSTGVIPDVGNIMGQYLQPRFDLPLLNDLLLSNQLNYKPGFDIVKLNNRGADDKKIADFYKGYGIDFQQISDNVDREMRPKFDKVTERMRELKGADISEEQYALVKEWKKLEREEENMTIRDLVNLSKTLENIIIAENVREIWIESECTNGRCQISSKIQVIPIEDQYTVKSFINALTELFEMSRVDHRSIPLNAVFQIDPRSITYANGVLKMKAGIYDAAR